MAEQRSTRGGDFYAEHVTDGYLAHRHSGTASPNAVMEQPAFVDAIGDVANLRVLDLGCGDGTTAPLFLDGGAACYHGIDGSPAMIARARRLTDDARASFEVADIEDVAPEPAASDLVVSRMALHYIADIAPVLARLRHALGDGGRLVFTVVHPVITSHDPDPDPDPDPGGRRTNWTVDDYFVPGARTRPWFGTTVTWHHRTVEDYVHAVLTAGFHLQALCECEPDRSLLADDPAELARRRRVPLMLLLSATCA